MCKVFIMTNMRQVEDVDSTINTIADLITREERDGFGYTIQGEEGLFGERTTETWGFETCFERELLDLPFLKPVNYNRFGTKTLPNGAGIFHGRTSTNHKNLLNTHPINKDGWSLIHNGVVTNIGPKYKMQTTNDTEHVLHYLSTQGIQGLEQNLTGYYAVAAFDPKNNLHIIKDSTANLFFAKLPQLDTFVFATTKRLIKDVCKEMEWEHSIIAEVKNNTYLIYNQDAELTHSSSFKPMGWGVKESKHASKSLGFDIGNEGLKDVKESSEDDEGYETLDLNDEKPKLNFTTYTSDEFRELYTEDEIMFLDEVNNCADHSYKFFDYHDNELSFEEFDVLDDNEKLYCTVVRSDGTIVDSQDHQSERLWEGSYTRSHVS